MDVQFLNYLSDLKKVFRLSAEEERQESTAEHTWGCLLLADYFLTKFDYDLDRSKVFDLMLYHDLVELEAGDTPITDEKGIVDKREKEMEAFNTITEQSPSWWSGKYEELFEEYEECETRESKFAHAIDKLEPMVQWFDRKDVWGQYGLTEELLREKKEEYFKPFPELKGVFEEILSEFNEKEFI